MFLFNNECENDKEINIYIDYLKGYVKMWISKSFVLACIPLNPSVLIGKQDK